MGEHEDDGQGAERHELGCARARTKGLVCGHKLPARQVMRFLRKPAKTEPNDSPSISWNHHINAQSMSTSGTSLRQGVMGSRVRDEVGQLEYLCESL